MAMEKFETILREATKAIKCEYFSLPVSGTDPVYRERVYCYELYHQMRCRWPENGYLLNGEIDKCVHPKIRGNYKPDFLIHKPGSDHNYAIIEVKSSRGIKECDISKDIKKLCYFIKKGYQKAIYLIYGYECKHVLDKIKEHITDVSIPIEVWVHSEVNKEAFKPPF